MNISEYHKAKQLKKDGKLVEAITAYQQAIEINPNVYSYHHELGEILAEKEDWEGAIASYSKAIELNPSSVWSYNNLGEIFAKQGQLDRAAKFYRRGMGIEPEHYSFYRGLGEVFAEKGARDKAARFFEKAAELYPKLGSADGGYPEYCYYLLTRACVTNGRWEKAVENCREAIALNPNNLEYYKIISQCFQQLEQLDEAVPYFEKIIKLHPTDENTYYWFGDILERQGKLKKAIEVYQQGVLNLPKNAILASHLQVLKGKQTLSEAYCNLADTFAQQGYLEEAIKAYHSSINLNPNSALFYNNLGEALYKKGDLDEAIRYYRVAVSINPNSYIFHKNLGDAFLGKGRIDKAIRIYEKVISLTKESYEAYEKLGDLLAIQQQWARAVDYYKMAEQLNPKFSMEEQFVHLGRIKQKQGKFYKAVSFYNQAIKLNENCRGKLPILIAKKEELGKIDVESNNQIVYTEIYPEKTFSLKPPTTVHSTIDEKFIEEKITSTISTMVIVPNGSVWINDAIAIAIADSKGEILIKDIFRGPNITVLPIENLPPVLKLDEPTAFLSVRCWEHNYYHWMLDLVPKIGLLKKSGIDIKNIGKFIVGSHSERPFQREILEILGIPKDKIVESKKHHYIHAKNLIIPCLLHNIAALGNISRWSCEWIKKEFINPEIRKKLDASERIYISRKDAPSRQVINESDVVEFLSKFGIRSVTLSSMSVPEQALLLASAKLVIAPHGAGLTNLLFCHPGTKVIELMSPDAVRLYYYRLSEICELDYYYLLGESVDAAKQDMIINIDLLSDLMKLASIS
ncbi:MAG: tetratricopeptide repeat protein [Okeania sp. SIO3B3]|nr:tetratricopeptide repeat protein [Okeania sp. SIO3B3]